jgi:uncharacterized membrane protein
MIKSRIKQSIPALIFCLVAISGIYVHNRLWKTCQDIEQQDIYYSYVEGSRLNAGVNPYERVLLGDMRTNDKYASYFPLFYLLSSGTQLAGLESFPAWLAFWRVIFLGCNIGIGYLIFQICTAKSQPWLGIFGALFWLFNRWTLHVTIINHLDFLPLLLLLLSLKFVPRRFSLACIFLGLSLAIKQIAILALPLYLIWSWQGQGKDRLIHLLKTFILIFGIPLLVSTPFLIWNAEGYVKSILFSATRYPADLFYAPSIDALLGCYGIPARIPMLILLGLIFALVLLRRIPIFSSLLLVMAVLFGFSSVLFPQYIVWFMPFIPLTILEIITVPEKVSKSTDHLPA